MKKLSLLISMLLTGAIFQSALAMDITINRKNNSSDENTYSFSANEDYALKNFYINADYGFATLPKPTIGRIDNASEGIFPLNINTPSVTSNFYSIGLGTQLMLSKHLGLRIGPEYDAFSANYSGNSYIGNNTETGDSNYSNNYSYKSNVKAIMLSTQLLYRPLTKANLFIYAGIKAGYASTKISDLSSSADDNGLVSYSFNGGKSSGLAYGFNAGLEYDFYQTVGIHAGIEQLNFGKTSALTNGEIIANNYPFSSDDIPSQNIALQVITVGLSFNF